MAVVVDWGKWRIAHVSKPKIKDIIKLLEDKQIDGLSLNDYHGFDAINKEFMENLHKRKELTGLFTFLA